MKLHLDLMDTSGGPYPCESAGSWDLQCMKIQIIIIILIDDNKNCFLLMWLNRMGFVKVYSLLNIMCR
jgi:hypothetical protein